MVIQRISDRAVYLLQNTLICTAFFVTSNRIPQASNFLVCLSTSTGTQKEMSRRRVSQMTLFCVPMKSSYSVPSAMTRTMVQAKSKSVFAFEGIQAVKFLSCISLRTQTYFRRLFLLGAKRLILRVCGLKFSLVK